MRRRVDVGEPLGDEFRDGFDCTVRPPQQTKVMVSLRDGGLMDWEEPPELSLAIVITGS